MRKRSILLSLWWLLACAVSFGADLSGEVVGVHDGDTITVLTKDKRSVKVRLYGIDAPESKQPYGYKAKERLSELVFGKQVPVNSSTNTGGRIVSGLRTQFVLLSLVASTITSGWSLKHSKRYVPQQEEAKFHPL